MNQILGNKETEISDKNDNIFDVDEANFVERVINASDKKIILVDFWAPWCGPCKQLTPALEDVVKESDNVVSLAKINVDENQQISAQLKIQSIPTVIAFKDKQIVNGFQGALPKNKILEFIEKIHGSPIKKNNKEFYIAISNLIENKKFEEAQNSIEDFISQNSQDEIAISLYIKCLKIQKKFEEIENFLNALSKEILSSELIKKELKSIELLKNSLKEPSVDILTSKFSNDPKNVTNLIKLSEKYFFEDQKKEAFELLLTNFVKYPKNDKEKLKKTLLNFFDALGNEHEQTKEYRKKLSSILFS